MRRVMVEEQGCGSDLQGGAAAEQEQTAAPEAKTTLTTELKHGSEYVSLGMGGGVGNVVVEGVPRV